MRRRDSGFGAWSLTDPTIVGDSVPAAGLNVLDMLRLQQHIIALSTSPTGGMPEFPPIPTLSLLALSTALPAAESGGAKVNWSGSFAASETAPTVAGTGAATDWMNAPWARDLAERLTTTHEKSESTRGILPGRELLRTLTRAFARR